MIIMERRTIETLQLLTVALSIFFIPFVVVYGVRSLLLLVLNESPTWFLRLLCIGPLCVFTITGFILFVVFLIMWTYARMYGAGYIPNEW